MLTPSFWNVHSLSPDLEELEKIEKSFSSTQGADELLCYYKDKIDELSNSMRNLIWVWALSTNHQGWQDLLWDLPAHQQDPVTHSLTVIMSSELVKAMSQEKLRQTIAYESFARRFKKYRPELYEDFEQEAAAWALQRAMITMRIEDQALLVMFSNRPEFAWMKFNGGGQQRDLAQQIALILTPVVELQERNDIDSITANQNMSLLVGPSILSTIKHCCDAGMIVAGTSGLDLGRLLARGVRAAPNIFQPILDCWITYGGSWQTLCAVEPDMMEIISLHPRVKSCILMEISGRKSGTTDEAHPQL